MIALTDYNFMLIISLWSTTDYISISPTWTRYLKIFCKQKLKFNKIGHKTRASYNIHTETNIFYKSFILFISYIVKEH